MLPVHRVIGHKEWAPGRKSDPIHSMPWRRGRVAVFRPRSGTVPPPPPAPEEEEIEMLIVNVNPAPNVWVPHLITGDRYFALESDETRKKLVAAGVKSITVGQAAHANFRANLSSEKDDPVAVVTPPPAPPA